MSPLEVKEAYKGFKQENKSDKINLEKFTKMVASMNTNKGMIFFTVQCTLYILPLLLHDPMFCAKSTLLIGIEVGIT